jgi:hypothetical protein
MLTGGRQNKTPSFHSQTPAMNIAARGLRLAPQPIPL